MTESMKVKHVVDNQQVIKALDKLAAGFEKVLKSSQKATTESKQGAEAVKGSFNALQQELRENERQLKNLRVGSQEFDRQSQKVRRLRDRVTELKDAHLKSNAAARQAGSTVGPMGTTVRNMATNMAGVAASFLSVREFSQAITKELEKQDRIRKQSADQSVVFQRALAEVALNVGAENIPEVRKRIEDEAFGLGATQAGMASLVGQAVSAGAKDVGEAFDLTRLALRATMGDDAAAANLMTTTLDVAKKAGTDDFAGVFGQILATQKTVRGIDSGTFFGNSGAALAQGSVDMQNVDRLSTEQIFERMAVASQVLIDAEGAESSTAVAKMIQAIDEFVPERKKKGRDGSTLEVSQALIDAYMGTRDIEERENLLMQNESMRIQMLNTIKKGKQKTFAFSYLSGGADGELERARAGIPSIADAGAHTERLLEGLESELGLLRTDMQERSLIEKAETTGPRGLIGQAESIFESTRSRIDEPNIDAMNQFFDWFDRKFKTDGYGTDPVASISELQFQLRRIRDYQPENFADAAPVSQDDRKTLDYGISLLTDLLTQAKEQTATQRDIAAPAPPVEQPVPAAGLGAQ